MTRPLVHLRERVRSERVLMGSDKYGERKRRPSAPGEEDRAGAQIWWQEEAYIRQADGNPPGADEAAEEAPCDDAAVFVSAYFPPGCGNRLDAAREK